MNTGIIRSLVDSLQKILIIVVLVGLAYYLFSGAPLPLPGRSRNDTNMAFFSESSLIDKVARLEVSGTSFMARTEAKRLIRDGVTDVQYSPSPKPTVTVRIRCGVYKGHESTWNTVLEHWSRYYCFKENIPNVEGRIVNCENRALLGGTYGFE